MASKRTLGFSSTVFSKKFRAGMTVRNYRDNEVVFSQGDAADAVFYIQSGTVKLTVESTRRKNAIVAVLLRGSFFGEGCLGGQSLRISTARSIGPSNITRLQKESTARTLKRDPQFAALFVAWAEMVGTTRARVSKFMNAFKKKGFLRYNGSLQINSGLIIAFLHSRPMSVVTKR